MAVTLFFLMIGMVCLLTLILFFCEYSCRGDSSSKGYKPEDMLHNHDPVEHNERQECVENNNISEEQSLVSPTTHQNSKIPPRAALPRRPSIKVLVRKESACSSNVPKSQPI